MNIYELADIDESKARNLEFKIADSIDLWDFSDEDHRLIYKLAGADLLNSSTTRALVMLYAKDKTKDKYE